MHVAAFCLYRIYLMYCTYLNISIAKIPKARVKSNDTHALIHLKTLILFDSYVIIWFVRFEK